MRKNNNPDIFEYEHLKNDTEESKNYKYSHNYPKGKVEQQYLPNSLKDRYYFKEKN